MQEHTTLINMNNVQCMLYNNVNTVLIEIIVFPSLHLNKNASLLLI